LHDGNWLETTGTQVRPGSGPVAPASPDEQPEQFIDFAHSLLLSALGSMWARDGSEGGVIGLPDTLTTPLDVCQEGGLRRYDLHAEQIAAVSLCAGHAQWDVGERARYMRVATVLERLRSARILDRDVVRVRGSAPILIAAIGSSEILGQMGEEP